MLLIELLKRIYNLQKKFFVKFRKKYIKKQKTINPIKLILLKDPKRWFTKASYYHSAVLSIHKSTPKGPGTFKGAYRIVAIQSLPYITGIAVELYLKGFLVSKGIHPNTLKNKYDHKLAKLRKKCYRVSQDERFENENLTFFTDKLGKIIMENGGIRYPDKGEIAIYINLFIDILDLLQNIKREEQL